MSPTRRAAVRLLVIFIGYAAIVAALSWAWYSMEKENFTRQLDQKLLAATGTLKDLLAPDFHDRARTPTSISLEEELENRRKFNALKEALGLTWVYTVIRTESGEYVFTAPSVSEEEAKERLSWYFYPYQEIPEAFTQALAQRGNATLEYRDEWGRFRSFCRTEVSPGGQPYLACADIDITQIETFTSQHLLITLGIAAVFLALTVPVGFTVRGMYREHLKALQEAHAVVTEQEASLRAVLENLPVGVAVVDAAERTVLSANPKLLEMLEATADQIIGKDCKKTVCTLHTNPLCPILDGVPLKNSDLALTTFTGRSVPVFKAAVPTTLGGKHVLVEALIDISAQKRLEADLIHAKEAAEAAARSKARFLAVMSHELRTPLGNILGTLQILPHLDTPDKQKPMTEAAQRAARALLTLLNDILDLAALEGTVLQPSPAVHPVPAILSPIIQIAEPQARSKGLSWEAPPHAGATHVKCDATLVRKALLHVVNNAIKFTARGTVRLESWTHGTGWYMAVHDTGTGIDPHLLDTIFAPFTQADMELNREYGGSGVGLGVASGITRLLGGSICVDSEPGAGATFVLAFPRAVANRETTV
jgi:signal transduction histidine kinase